MTLPLRQFRFIATYFMLSQPLRPLSDCGQDIYHSGDGGLHNKLLQNRAFQRSSQNRQLSLTRTTDNGIRLAISLCQWTKASQHCLPNYHRACISMSRLVPLGLLASQTRASGDSMSTLQNAMLLASGCAAPMTAPSKHLSETKSPITRCPPHRRTFKAAMTGSRSISPFSSLHHLLVT